MQCAPESKAKVEGGVLIAERQILAVLRDQRFFNVGELNQAITPLLAKLNEQPFQKLEGSRNSWFESLERSQLLPLPAMPFELGLRLPQKNVTAHSYGSFDLAARSRIMISTIS